MNKQELVTSLKCDLFGSRDTIHDAYEYALDVLGRDAPAWTAIQVLLNTVAKEIEKMEV